MAWANKYMELLKNNQSVTFRPFGSSMLPKIKSGQLCTVVPITDDVSINVGDVVLCKVNGAQYLHYVGAIRDDRYRIENAKCHINGWIGLKNIFGKLIKIED